MIKSARPRIVGILGGVASGKSFVAKCLEELGAGRLDADKAGHEVLTRPEVIAKLREHWGDAVVDEAGQIARPAVAKIVFARTPEASRELAFLEQITHPLIGALLQKRIEGFAESCVRLLVLDAPVMLKAGWDRFCDTILFVDVPTAERLRRAQSRGWTEAEFHAREAMQESVEIKRRAADFVVDNAGEPEATKSQITRLWPLLIG